MISKYKKGAFFDTFFFIIVLVVLVIGGIFIVNILNPVVASFQADPNLGAEAQAVLEPAAHAPEMQDNIVLIVFIVLWITVLVAAYQIDSHPLFFIVMAVIMLIFTLAAGMLGELTSQLFADGNLIDVASQMPISNFIANNVFLITILVAFSVMLVMFAKRQGVGQ